jgi:hypothetical protein
VVYLTMLSVPETIYCRMRGWLVNNELERIWKEAVMTWFKLLSQNILGVTEKTTKTSDSQSLDQDSNLRPPKYKTEMSSLSCDTWQTFAKTCVFIKWYCKFITRYKDHKE